MKKMDFVQDRKLAVVFFLMGSILLHPFLIAAQKSITLKNSKFELIFNESTKEIHIVQANNLSFISGAETLIHFDSLHSLSLFQSGKIETQKVSFSNELGRGEKLVLTSTNKDIKLQWEIALYDTLSAITFETFCTNLSNQKSAVKSIEPFTTFCSGKSFIAWPNASKCLTNGAMYYDAGAIHSFGNPYQKPEPYGETKGGVLVNNQWDKNPQTIQSWWNIGIFSGYNNQGLSIGYIENKAGLGRIQTLKTDDSKISVSAESVFAPGVELQPGQTISSDRLLIQMAPDPYRVLEDYASAMSKTGKANIGKVVNGWCNWFYTLDQFSEEEIIQNATFAAKYLKPYGLEYIQIDEGFQTLHGEWEGNSRFPHGLKWLAKQIKALGLKPGIWISPFVISETTDVFKNHPEWLLKDEKGELKRIGPWPNENTDWYRNETPKRYGLDITHPEAEKWYTSLIDTLANNWGFEMIKVDFVAWTLFSAHHFYDTAATPAQVYAKALKIMRYLAGNKCHILDCGPGNISVGSINSMRVEYDQNYGYRNEVWKQYFLGSSCSAGAAGKRYFYHNRTWTNDADHVCIDLLSDQQAQAAASIISLSGGNLMSGDRLTFLDESKLEILQKVFPATGINAKPVDLFDTDPQTAFAAQFHKSFAHWTVAGFFNPDLNQPAQKNFPLERLWLPADKNYLLYDFWNEAFMGEVSDSISITIDPGSVKLLSIHEKKGVPQFISTTRHTMQGAIELENCYFDASRSELSGISTAPLGSSHDVLIYIPEPYYWIPTSSKLYSDNPNYTVKMADNQILRIRLKFTDTEKINWVVAFKRN